MPGEGFLINWWLMMATIYNKNLKKLLSFVKFFNIWFLFYDCLLKQSLITVKGDEVFLFSCV